MQKIKLKIINKRRLRIIVNYYYIHKEGMKKIDELGDVRELLDLELIFKTSNGYFPSTKGQDYINNYG